MDKVILALLCLLAIGAMVVLVAIMFSLFKDTHKTKKKDEISRKLKLLEEELQALRHMIALKERFVFAYITLKDLGEKVGVNPDYGPNPRVTLDGVTVFDESALIELARVKVLKNTNS